ncbi:hypothetical protein HID58_014911, partial [Brassica napus]
MMLYAVLICLMLGTTSPWVGSEFSCLLCFFLAVGLPLIVHARLGFQDLFFSDLTFILLFSLCSLILLHFSLLVASLVALHFAMFATPGLDSVFPHSLRAFVSYLVAAGYALGILFFSLCYLISLYFSSLVASLVAFHFAIFDTLDLDSVFF